MDENNEVMNEQPVTSEQSVIGDQPVEDAVVTGAVEAGTAAYTSTPIYTETPYGYENSSRKEPEVPNVPPKKEKKKPNIFVRGLKFVVSAIVFGAIAGAAIYGICYLGNKVLPIPGMQQETVGQVQNTPIINFGSSTEKGDNDTVSTPVDNFNVKEIAKADMPAMVEITSKITTTSYFGTSTGTSGGTGVIIGQNDTDLFIVTNAHVVENATEMSGLFVDGKSAKLTLQGMKSSVDIAVVSVKKADLDSETLNALSIIKIGNSDEVEVGDPVVVIGNALGEGQSVTVGYISALNRTIVISNRTYENLFLTDAAINSGNSGGALINAKGELIGINSAHTNLTVADSMGYSIPINNVKDIIDKLISKVERQEVSEDKAGYLGIRCQDITASLSSYYGYPQGVFLTEVISGSPAEKAGLAESDIIVGIDDTTITNYDALKKNLKYYAIGETVTIEYYHYEGKAYVLKKTDVVLGSAIESTPKI